MSVQNRDMNDLRHRLRTKLMVQQAVQKAIKTPTREQLDTMIAEQLAEAALKAKREELPYDENLFIWHDGRELDIQSLVLDVMFDLIKRDPNILSLSLKLRNGKMYELSWHDKN